jgi:hypothetical protein
MNKIINVSFYCDFLTFGLSERGKLTAFVKLNNFNRKNGVPRAIHKIMELVRVSETAKNIVGVTKSN